MTIRRLGKVALTAGGLYNAQTTYAPMTQVRGANATYLSIAESKGVALTDTNYWQLVVRDGTSQSGGGGSPVYLANYALSGAANAEAPAMISDTTGNGNDITVNNIAAYDENGHLAIAGESASLYIPSVDLKGYTNYTMHMKLAHGALNGQHRLLHIPANDLHVLLSNAENDSTLIKIESAHEAPGFVSPILTLSLSPVMYRTTIRDLTLDIAVSGDEVTFSMEAQTSGGAVATLQSAHTIQGFTSYLSQGVYLGNRADGTRPLGVAIREFWIRGA